MNTNNASEKAKANAVSGPVCRKAGWFSFVKFSHHLQSQ